MDLLKQVFEGFADAFSPKSVEKACMRIYRKPVHDMWYDDRQAPAFLYAQMDDYVSIEVEIDTHEMVELLGLQMSDEATDEWRPDLEQAIEVFGMVIENEPERLYLKMQDQDAHIRWIAWAIDQNIDIRYGYMLPELT